MKRIILIILFLFSGWMLEGQGVSRTEARKARAKVFDTLHEYENISSFYSESDKRALIRLFGDNEDAPVFMDLMGSSDFRFMVTVRRYLDYIEREDIHPFFHVKVLSVGEPEWKGMYLKINVVFQKSVSYFDKHETYYSSRDYYGAETVLTASFLYDPGQNTCVIERIDGKIDSRIPDLPEQYFVLRKNTEHPQLAEYDELLVRSNNIRPFNAYNQAFVITDPASLKTWDDDLVMSCERTPLDARYSSVIFNYRFMHYRQKPRISFAPWGAYSLQGAGDIQAKSSAMEAGFDLGRQFRITSSIALGAYTGIAVSMGKLALQDQDIQYGFPMNDRSGTLYERNYDIREIRTGLAFSDLMIPVYGDVDIIVAQPVHVHVNAGVKTYLNMGTKVDPCHIVADITQDYPGAVSGKTEHLDERIASFLQPESYERKPFDLSVTAGIQADYCPGILHNRIAAFAGVSFEQGITESFHSEALPYCDPDHGIYPVFYNDAQQKDLIFAPMVSGVSYRRKAVWMSGGLIVKF